MILCRLLLLSAGDMDFDLHFVPTRRLEARWLEAVLALLAQLEVKVLCPILLLRVLVRTSAVCLLLLALKKITHEHQLPQ